MVAASKDDVRLALVCALAFTVVRGALHLATFPLPLSSDDAVPMIQVAMLRHGQPVTTLINQPYNGALDTYLIAPLTFIFSAHAAFRVYQLLAAAALIGGIAALARRAAGREAAWTAALLASIGTPYMAMNTAIGPVPNFLVGVVVALVLILLWPISETAAGVGRGFAAGITAGLGTWNTALTIPCLAGSLGGLAAAGVPLGRSALGFVPGFAVGLVPAVVGKVIGASGVTAATRVQPYQIRTVAHWGEGVAAIGRTLQGLFGVQIPLVVDGPQWTAFPAPAMVLLAAALLLLLVAGIRRRTLPLLGWTIAFSAAFALSARTDGEYVRYAYNLTIPVLVLIGVGLVRVWQWRRSVALALAAVIVGEWLAGQQIVLRHWRDPQHAARVWQVPDLTPSLATLQRLGLRSAYASLHFACRLVVESEGRVIATQAWNERMPGDPMRFRDEVDLDPQAAWVLSSWISRGMPRAASARQEGFAEDLRELGGQWREQTDGEMTTFYGFTPPFDETRPVPAGQMAVVDESGLALPPSLLDRDGRTGWRAPIGLSRGAGIGVRVTPVRRLSAIVLGVDLDRSPLGVPWVATVDGRVVARGPHRFAMQWVGGVPRVGKQALMTIVLPEATPVSEVKVVFQGAGPPLAVSEVFAYGPDEAAVPAAGAAAAAAAYDQARAGNWKEAVHLYEDAARREPERAGYYAALERARWRAAHRQVLDVESLDDGGDAVLGLK
jgi:hypothetical protein